VRVRSLGGEFGKTVSQVVHELGREALAQEKPFLITGQAERRRIWISLKPVLALKQKQEFAPLALAETSAVDLGEELNFRKSLLGTVGFCLLVAGISAIWPAGKKNEEELIPPQIAKVL